MALRPSLGFAIFTASAALACLASSCSAAGETDASGTEEDDGGGSSGSSGSSGKSSSSGGTEEDAEPTPEEDAAPDAEASKVSVLVSGQSSPRGVAADADYVYFASITGNAIYRVAVTGGAATRVDSGGTVSKPWVHAVDDTHVYFANLGSKTVSRVPKAGGAAELLVEDVDVWSLVIDATTVYFTVSPLGGKGAVEKVAKSCSAPCTATIVVPEQEGPMGLATDGSFLYWANRSQKVTYAYPGGPVSSREYEGTLRKWSVSSTTTDPAATTLLAGLRDPAGAAVGGGFAFVGTTEDETVRAISIGSPSEVLLAQKVGSPLWMAADETHVYWLSGGAGAKSVLYRSPKDKKGLEALAINQVGPIGITMTADAVYWANSTAGEIMRFTK
jgi:sugar lactone lactonase YvrE